MKYSLSRVCFILLGYIFHIFVNISVHLLTIFFKNSLLFSFNVFLTDFKKEEGLCFTFFMYVHRLLLQLLLDVFNKLNFNLIEKFPFQMHNRCNVQYYYKHLLRHFLKSCTVKLQTNMCR